MHAVGDVQSNRFGIELGGVRQGVQLSVGQQDEPASQVCCLVDASALTQELDPSTAVACTEINPGPRRGRCAADQSQTSLLLALSSVECVKMHTNHAISEIKIPKFSRALPRSKPTSKDTPSPPWASALPPTPASFT